MKKLLCVLMFGMVFGGEVSQRTIDVTIESGLWTNLSEIFPEYNLEWAIINLISCPVSGESCYIYSNLNPHPASSLWWRSGQHHYVEDKPAEFYVKDNYTFYFYIGPTERTVKLLVTAEFPQEDTGYIEDGFDYCLAEGQNLIASPCREPIPIETALPSEIANNLTGIIGEGVASTNIEGIGWVGSLTGLGGGKGYWFSSNVEGCFNYTCTEN